MLMAAMGSSPPTQKPPGMRFTLAGAAPWLVFLGAMAASAFIHELGHCVVAWAGGYPAIPTPAKEYILRPMPSGLQAHVSLGGIVGSVAALLAAAFWLYRRSTPVISAIFAGAIAISGAYTLRFLLLGRGHDATEFQEAQAALGCSYSGHAVDRLFLCLFVLAAVFWFWRTRARLTIRLLCRLLLGGAVALAFLVLLQSVNNRVFDPLFEPKTKENPSRGE